jgi:hypothetical protein
MRCIQLFGIGWWFDWPLAGQYAGKREHRNGASDRRPSRPEHFLVSPHCGLTGVKAAATTI